MTSEITERYRLSVTIRVILGLAALALLAVLLAVAPPPSSRGWLLALSLAATAGVCHAVGLRTSLGRISFMPVAVLTGYLAFGLPLALLITATGLLGARLIGLPQRQARQTGPRLLGMAAWALGPLAQNALALLAAEAVYRLLGAAPPLVEAPSRPLELLAVVAAPAAYMLTYSAVAVVEGGHPREVLLARFRQYREAFLAVQILALGIAPIAALALYRVGPLALVGIELLLVTVALLVGGLLASQQALHRQVSQLARIGAISNTLNSTLNPGRLLARIVEAAVELSGSAEVAIYVLSGDMRAPWLEPAAASRPLASLPSFPALTSAEVDDLLAQPVLQPGAAVPGGARVTLGALAAAAGGGPFIGVPLQARGNPIGLLIALYPPGVEAMPGSVEVLQTFASHAALALVNAQAYEQADMQLARQVGQIVRVADITQRLNTTLNLEAVTDLIVRAAVEGTPAARGCLLMLADQNGGPRAVAWQGYPADPTQRLLEGDTARSVLTGEPGQLLAAASDGSTQLWVPISSEGRPIGALTVEADAPAALSHDDLSLLRQLALQGAVAVRNAQLYRDVQQVRDRLHAILDASQDGLLMLGPTGEIVMTNASMERFWDFGTADAGTLPPDAPALDRLGVGLGYPRGTLARMLADTRQDPARRHPPDLYSTRPTPAGYGRHVERAATPVTDENGAFMGMLLLFRDVTEQKEMEEARQNLTSMIVHELRAPLQGIRGAMNLIERAAPEGNQLIEQATTVSQRSIKRLLNLVNNLLDLSRMERGEFVLDPSTEAVAPIVAEAAEELAPLAAESGITVGVDVSEGLPPVQVDRDMIARVVVNLLDNALKYAPPGSEVTIQAAQAAAAGEGRPQVCISVMDEGQGVPPEYRAAIFEQYVRVPGKRARRRSAGLGLAFCKLAVESHGGAIWVEDGPAGGAMFRFTLPVR